MLWIGPIVIEIDYRVDRALARDDHEAMQAIRAARLRNGGFEWSLARDIAAPEPATECYHFPIWGDYLRQRDRTTQADHDRQVHADSFHREPTPDRARRRLERPFGSVRWRAATPGRQDVPTPIH